MNKTLRNKSLKMLAH